MSLLCRYHHSPPSVVLAAGDRLHFNQLCFASFYKQNIIKTGKHGAVQNYSVAYTMINNQLQWLSSIGEWFITHSMDMRIAMRTLKAHRSWFNTEWLESWGLGGGTSSVLGTCMCWIIITAFLSVYATTRKRKVHRWTILSWFVFFYLMLLDAIFLVRLILSPEHKHCLKTWIQSLFCMLYESQLQQLSQIKSTNQTFIRVLR